MFYYDENNTRDMIVSVHQQTTGYIVNQLVRNWFSDSISPKWWDYIWFSDGLAKYFEYITVGEVSVGTFFCRMPIKFQKWFLFS